MLGDAFLSARGAISAADAKLHESAVGLIFGTGVTGWEQECRNVPANRPEPVVFVWVPANTVAQREFTSRLAMSPAWVGIPPTHMAQRQKLRDAFDIAEQTELVLLDKDRIVISRAASRVVECVCYANAARSKDHQAAVTRVQLAEHRGEEMEHIAKDLVKIAPQRNEAQRAASRLEGLRVDEVAAIAAYADEPAETIEASQAVDAAAAELERARSAIESLSLDLVEELASSQQEPPAPVKAAVCAAAICLGRNGNFSEAKLRVVRPAAKFVQRMISRDTLSAGADAQLHSFVTAPPPAPTHVVAHAIHGWVMALLAHHSARRQLEAVQLAVQPNAFLQCVVECVAELSGLRAPSDGTGDVDLRTALRFAKAFPDDIEEAVAAETNEDVEAHEERCWTLSEALNCQKEESARLTQESAACYTSVTQAHAAMSSGEHSLTIATLSGANRLDELSERVIKLLLLTIAPAHLKSASGDIVTALRLAFGISSSDATTGRPTLLSTATHLLTHLQSDTAGVQSSTYTIQLAATCCWDVSSWPRIAHLLEKLPSHDVWTKARPAMAGTMRWLRAMIRYQRVAARTKAIAVDIKNQELELSKAQSALNALLDAEKTTGVSMYEIASVLRAVGGGFTREQTAAALRVAESETRAVALLQQSKAARTTMARLATPPLCSSTDVEKVSYEQVTRLRASLSNRGVTQLLAALKGLDEKRERKRRKLELAEAAEATARAAAASSAQLVGGPVGAVALAQPAAHEAVQAAAVPLVAAHAPLPNPRKRPAAEMEKEALKEEQQLQQAVERYAPGITSAELQLLRWASAVADYAEARRFVTPREEVLLRRRTVCTDAAARLSAPTCLAACPQRIVSTCELYAKEADRFARGASKMREKVVGALKGMRIDPSLVPFEVPCPCPHALSVAGLADLTLSSYATCAAACMQAPWARFPWHTLRPCAEVEDQMRCAMGNRDMLSLFEHLKQAASLGLCKATSKIFFEAATLAASLRHESARCELYGFLPGPAVEVELAQRAFLEPVDLSVCTTAPKHITFVDVLTKMGAEFSPLIVGLQGPKLLLFVMSRR
jgi:hypothetical protein